MNSRAKIIRPSAKSADDLDSHAQDMMLFVLHSQTGIDCPFHSLLAFHSQDRRSAALSSLGFQVAVTLRTCGNIHYALCVEL